MILKSKYLLLTPLLVIGLLSCSAKESNTETKLPNNSAEINNQTETTKDDLDSALIGKWQLVHDEGYEKQIIHEIEITASKSNYGQQYTAPLTGDLLFFDVKDDQVTFKRSSAIKFFGREKYYIRASYKYQGTIRKGKIIGSYTFIDIYDYGDSDKREALPEIDQSYYLSPVKWHMTRIK